MSAWTRRFFNGKAAQEIVPPRPRIPWWKGPGADSEEKHEPASDIDTALMDSLKVLDPKGPIREADMPDRQLRAMDRHQRCNSKEEPPGGGSQIHTLRMQHGATGAEYCSSFS